jgi:hypothetical protein
MNGALTICGRKQSWFVSGYYLRISLKQLRKICNFHAALEMFAIF